MTKFTLDPGLLHPHTSTHTGTQLQTTKGLLKVSRYKTFDRIICYYTGFSNRSSLGWFK